MKTIAIIPVRMAASRFPNKPMANILGLPMVAHCYYRSELAKNIDYTYVATCDREIYDYMKTIGGNVVMTADTHNRASDRTAEALTKAEQEIGHKLDVVIMVQGDEPLISPEVLDMIPAEFADPNIEIVNIVSKLTSKEMFQDRNNVKTVMNINNDVLYFSREPIPSPYRGDTDIPMYMQVGVIAFSRAALINFNDLEETRLEQIESVDMNRILENGGSIRAVKTETRNIGVDTPEELGAVEEIMKNDPFYPSYAKS